MLSRIRQYRYFARYIGFIAAAISAFVATSGVAQGPALAMLDRLEPGQWEVRARPEGSAFKICIDNGRKLIQMRHQGDACRRFVVDDTAEMVTVHYTCPANGYGQTTIRFDNPRLVRLETQGISKGLPYNFSGEARRLGSCR